jgi:hypothetical protein
MAVVMVEIRPKGHTHTGARKRSLSELEPKPPTVDEPEQAELVEDMDEYIEHVMCSCSAGDDNPY